MRTLTIEGRAAMPNDPFVDVGDLPSLGPLRYLDLRDQAAFDAGHARGAVRVPLDEWDAVAKAADSGFVKTGYWDDALSALGVDLTVTAVAYDSGGMTNAARVWFILQYFGLKAVILNGGDHPGHRERQIVRCRRRDRHGQRDLGRFFKANR